MVVGRSVGSVSLLLLATCVDALSIPQNAKRVHVYGMGTLIEGYGLEGQQGLMVDPVIAALDQGKSAWQKYSDALMRNKASAESRDTDAGCEEAARKLVSNHAMVLRDVTNSMPRSQLYLERVGMDAAPYADQALREVCRRLLGCPSEIPEERLETPEQAHAWACTVAYLTRRIQAAHVECPGRAPDLSEEAASAMRAALAEVEQMARAAIA